MAAYILVSITSGLLFDILDGIINANPLAVRLLSVYKPIARPKINMLAGILIDLLYGFLLAGLLLLLLHCRAEADC